MTLTSSLARQATRLTRLPRRRVDGVLLLDKPSGMTSNAALQMVKRALRAEKAGHTGTLDPAATGLIALCFGEATKFAGGLLDADKVYEAVVKLGIATSTGDGEGEVLAVKPVYADAAAVEWALGRFRGRILQTPPMHSAIKFAGIPLYAYARKGLQVERQAREVVIHALEFQGLHEGDLRLLIRCGKGTYIRTLAEDIGAVLGCGAHLAGLRRTGVGPFRVDQAVALEALEAMPDRQMLECLLSADALVSELPSVVLGHRQARLMLHGQPVMTEENRAAGPVRLYEEEGGFLGVGEVVQGGMVNPRRLVAQDPGN